MKKSYVVYVAILVLLVCFPACDCTYDNSGYPKISKPNTVGTCEDVDDCKQNESCRNKRCVQQKCESLRCLVGSTFQEEVSSVAVDSKGSVIVVGRFAKHFLIGSFSFSDFTGQLTDFIVKFDKFGTLLWAKSIRYDDGTQGYIDTPPSYYTNVSVDKHDRIHLFGNTRGSLYLGKTKILSAHSKKAELSFQLSFSPKGSLLSKMGFLENSVEAFKVLDDGTKIFVGIPSGNGKTTIGGKTYAFKSPSFFVARYYPTNRLQWVKFHKMQTPPEWIGKNYQFSIGNDVKLQTSNDGSVFVSASAYNLHSTRKVKPQKNSFVFLYKISSQGKLVWMKSLVSKEASRLFDMKVQGKKIYLASEGTTTQIRKNFSLVSIPERSLLVLDLDGKLLKQKDLVEPHKSLTIVPDGNGRVYTFGFRTDAYASYEFAYFFEKLDAQLKPLWTRVFQTNQDHLRVRDVVVRDQVYVVGSMTGTLKHGKASFSSSGGIDGFLIRMLENSTF